MYIINLFSNKLYITYNFISKYLWFNIIILSNNVIKKTKYYHYINKNCHNTKELSEIYWCNIKILLV